MKGIRGTIAVLGILGACALVGASYMACAPQSQTKVALTADDSEEGGSEKSGSQLWGENCQRCHNIRSPGEFSDAQWDLAVRHMRIRANLTAEEASKIAAFLKSSN